MNIISPLNLENLIKDSNTVVYFTHDYFSEVPDKNQQLLQTVDICKAYKVTKVIVINPLEFVNYYNDNNPQSNPLKEESTTHDEAM
jgi:hypothetical protein